MVWVLVLELEARTTLSLRWCTWNTHWPFTIIVRRYMHCVLLMHMILYGDYCPVSLGKNA